ncbi:hypothetical protein [Pseudoalteromonas luteoviolacea]|uniref:Uncharacterized protein n=1 Tax=Pseudoalteromonas luteoviolacea H33 TaxID=1365251 RepID=A0A167FSD3_9GAMM|nr:hypothetical protein [Pseudoalteromonas luteoviolacea]KZN52801.1 hypothetical protein N476_26580 [Pseudoalteromonas luteoviolacea H33]KZN54223.1 hypothetical protein N476_08490 [Pseudoalteromonas luteoviolacea H33]KZN78246.1 hypothetical protein N477_09035 [Pseudoalteromonas luteoviolacea H33-S]MBQ4877500.1 hypothetical protein [Pseudoalteromonas luteoviolacea]MBQ4906401.1 hypothetical protein [Pseudoalteromonas luteoviolacea]
MTDFIREVVATVLFVVAVVALYILFSAGFNLIFCLLVPTSFVSAYFIWPKRENREKGSTALDILEAIVLFPVECFIWISRLLYSLLGFLVIGKDSSGLD